MRNRYQGALRYADTVLEQLPRYAVLIVDYTVAQPLLYEKQIEHRRPDVRVAVLPPGEQVAFVRGLSWNVPVFLALTEPYYDIEGLRNEHDIRPEGLVYRLLPKVQTLVSADRP